MTGILRKLSTARKRIKLENVQNECRSKSRSPKFCELRYLDHRSTEIAISGDSYLEATPSARAVEAKFLASRGIDRSSHRKNDQYFL
eukprot:6186777-Pleurochrysis_carterae.AAC.1